MNLRSILSFLLAGLLVLGSVASAATAYRPPNLDKEIFKVKKVELDRFDRSGAVSSLVSVARDFDEEDEVDYELRAHALAIASRLDEDNEGVVLTLEQLKDSGKTIGEEADKSGVTRRLTSAVRALLRTRPNQEPGADNQACAAYIANIAVRLDPEGEYAERLQKNLTELAAAGHKPDWSGMLGSPIRHATNPWEEEEVVFEKKEVIMPGGEGEKFAQPQSRVNGLVVRQIGSGNLAGSASTVNATALRERGQEDLLFTFNQDVGPMMGGCLEEVIKFLRIRYVDHPEKIPTGYKIELGFQDKYVPKDGPSAATAFTLLLDSLFSGEEIDENFACTGDMTADGMVQKIGGAAAKIRGATKRGCRIVGIPLDNGKEIGDVLLLDGIQQLVDIQIFTLKDFDEAYAISRLEKETTVQETLDLFNSIAEVLNRDGESALANPKVQERLEEVVKRMPNHLSAQLLLQKGKGTNPKILTVRGTMSQIEIATSGTLRSVGRQVMQTNLNAEKDEAIEFDKETVSDAEEALKELESLEKAIDPRLKDYRDAVAKVCRSVADGRQDGEEPAAYGKRLQEELESMQTTYRKTMQDPEILEDME